MKRLDHFPLARLAKSLILPCLINLSAAPVLLMVVPAPALAAQDFSKACELYSARKYSEARPLLEDTVKKYPAFWPGHYYLGHTYLARGQNSQARAEYETCQHCHPTAEVYAACQKALGGLGAGPGAGGGTTASGAAASAAPVDPLAGADGSDASKNLSPQERALEENKKWVRKAADDEVARLRVEKQEAIDNCNAGANRRFRRLSDGTRYLSDPVELERLNTEYDARIKKVKDDADKKIQGMH